jgi:DNA-binding FadR family transcriptional regulator
MRHDVVANGDGLRLRGLLYGQLRHGPLLDAHQWLAGDAIEDVHVSRLGRVRNALAQLAVDHHVEQHHGVRAAVIPDVMVDGLVVPAVFAGLRFQRHY